MIEDPLALTVQMIAVLAAGMYPVGFLFGVCSDCCGCPPCTKCNHYYNQTGCQAVESFEVSIEGYGTLATTLINNFANADCLDGVEPELQLTNAFSPPCGGGPYTVRAQLRFDAPNTQDECGCNLKVFDGEVRFLFGGGNEVLVEVSDDTPLSCEAATVTVGFNAAVSAGGLGACEQDFLDFVNALVLSGSYDRAACDCGACCDDGCEDNVAEGGCGSWAGVGTSCDDDPNPCV